MNRTFFTRKAVDIDELKRRTGQEQDKRHFFVEKVIELPLATFREFAENLLAEFCFLRDNAECMYIDNNQIWHCVLIRAEGAQDGILVEAEGYEYARYAAYWSHEAEETQNKKTFRVSAIGKEYFPAIEIEADTQEEAEAEYRQAWESGGFLSPKYELNVTSVEIQAKPYLAKYTIIEGEHEYSGELLLTAHTLDEATNIAKSQEHEPIIPDDDAELTYWDYEDGTTASRLVGVVELTQQEAEIIHRLGIVNYFNR